MGDTATSVNQGGASGSTGIQLGGKQMRMAAAEARRVLVEMAPRSSACRPMRSPSTTAWCSAKTIRPRSARYAELIGGRYFNVQLDWNKEIGNPLYAPGKAQPKTPSEHKIVGQPIGREDIAPKVYAQEDFCTDVKVPGMVHGRVIRPPVAGAAPVKVDESSIKDIPGAKVVWEKGFLGVVADKEWDAVKAAQTAEGGMVGRRSRRSPSRPRSTTTSARPRYASARSRARKPATSTRRSRPRARMIEAEYEWPFQSHACMGPACAVVEIKDGKVTCWTGSQKPHFVRNGIAATLGMPMEKVRAIWMVGPGSYGRSDADDAAMDAAVSGQGGRQAGARAIHARAGNRLGPERAGVDPSRPRRDRRCAAMSSAYEFTSKGFSRIDVNTNGGMPWDTLAGQLRGVPLKSATGSACRRNPTRSPTSAWRGRRFRRCSTAARRCAARTCAIRSGRRCISPASCSWTRWRRRSTSIRSSSGCGMSRTRATSR